MKKKIIFSILSAGLLLSLLIACSQDYLDTVPTASANDVILANEKGVNAVLIGAYALIDGSLGTDGTSWGASVSNWVWGGVASDDATKGSDIGDQSAIVPIENYSVDATNVYIGYKWRFNYAGIARANDVLKIMKKCNPALSDATQTAIKAQVCFIRGFEHFELRRVFEQIPYITEDVPDPTKVTNTTEVWPMIETDLKFAVANLPTTQSEVGRPTKYAAEAILARVYLFQKKWNDAKPLLDDIIASGKYSLMPNFSDNFVAAKRNNKESIFEVQYSVNDQTNSPNAGWGDALNFPVDIDGTGTCCGFYQPTQNLVNAFRVDPVTGLPVDLATNFKNDMGITSNQTFVQDTVTPVDPRLDLTVGRRGVPYLDWGIMRGSTWIRDQGNAGPYLNKKNMFLKKDKGTLSTTTGWATGVNSNSYRAIRYAHVLLWRAEVAAETGDLVTATSLVNQIRTRAQAEKVMGRCRTFVLSSQTGLKIATSVPAANYLVNPYPATFANLDAARKAIRTEQRLEMAMEGFRFFDLVRWGIAQTTISAYIEQDKAFRSLLGGTKPAVYASPKNDYWPLPQTQVDLQPGVLTQRAGY
jgi:starch-binding outer membrane protein, SusD/RagB family